MDFIKIINIKNIINIMNKHYSRFYQKWVKYMIFYLILNIIAITDLIIINKFYINYLNKDLIDIHNLLYYSIFIVIYFLLNYISNYIDVRYICFNPLSDMFFKSYSSILSKDYYEFCNNNSNNYLYYIFEVPQMLLTSFPSFIYILSSILEIVIVVLILLYSAPIPFLIVFILCVLIEIALGSFYKKFFDKWNSVSSKTKLLQNNIVSIFTSIWHIKVYSLKKYGLNMLKNLIFDYSNAYSDNKYNDNLLNICAKAKNYFIEIIYILLLFCLKPGNQLDIVQLIFLVFLLDIFIERYTKISNSTIDIKKSIKLLSDFNEIFKTNEKTTNFLKENKFNIIKDKNKIITIKDGSFSYKNVDKERLNSLKNITFTINKGDKIVIVGENGSGKTTLLKLLSNILKLDNGIVNYKESILDFDKYNKTNLKINFVSSIPYIFNISLKDNIVFGNIVTDLKVQNILDNLSLNKFYNSLQNNIESIIEKNSLTISDGEKLRVALARSILNKENIEVIFLDEFTKNIDSNTEEKVINELFTKFYDKTIIAVSHRLSTILKFNKIIFLDNNNKKILYDDRDIILNSLEFRKLFQN